VIGLPEFGVIRPVSDCALSVEFENKISEEIHERVFSFCALLESRRPAGGDGMGAGLSFGAFCFTAPKQ